MQSQVGDCGKAAYPFGNAVGHGPIVCLATNILQRCAVGLLQNVDAFPRKIRWRQSVVMIKTGQPTIVDQREFGALLAFGRRQDMNRAWHRFALLVQGVQSFGNNLRRQAGNGKQTGGIRMFHAFMFLISNVFVERL